jgi:hypothetical protein
MILMKMTVLSEIAPSSGLIALDDGGSKHLRNVGQFLPDYTAQHPKRPSYSPP